MKIAVVIPTIRPESFKNFLVAWTPLFKKHNVDLVTVWDGKNPYVTVNNKNAEPFRIYLKEIMGKYADSISNFNGGVRNLGFAYVAKYLKDVETIITLDDDEVPIGDPIQDHIDALNMRVPISWMATAGMDYMRGFPYAVRSEAEVVISHGVWEGVADWDGPTQLVKGNHPVEFYKGPIPKGIYYPMCCMNLAFKVKMLPTIYHAPWALNVHRFDDMFAGITSKRECDKQGWAVVTGYARVNHQRESNVFKNLINEGLGIQLNETYWQGDEAHPYFKVYNEKLKLWKEFLKNV